MPIELNHTIVPSRNKKASSTFLAELLGLPEPTAFGPFLAVQLDNGVTLDYLDVNDTVAPMHYAFLLSDADFDATFARIEASKITYWADPFHSHAGTINKRNGGRGLYFEDPDGHNLEILTRPYDGGKP